MARINRLAVVAVRCFVSWTTSGVAQIWQKTPIDMIRELIGLANGFPIPDSFGDVRPVLPTLYSPSFQGVSDGYRFLTIDLQNKVMPVLNCYLRKCHPTSVSASVSMLVK